MGKSKVELAHHEAAIRVFGAASSRQAIVDNAFTHGARWVADITAVTDTGLKIAIEYDDAYWHADKATIDTAKSLDLLAAGWLVARLREHPPPTLGIDHPRYAELVVYATRRILMTCSLPCRSGLTASCAESAPASQTDCPSIDPPFASTGLCGWRYLALNDPANDH